MTGIFGAGGRGNDFANINFYFKFHFIKRLAQSASIFLMAILLFQVL
jgi:hypothetical protein